MKQKQISQNWINFQLNEIGDIKVKVFQNPKKQFVAKASQLGILKLGCISVDNLFLDLPEDEQEAIILHEYWHYKNNLKFEISLLLSGNFWVLFRQNKLSQLQEFEADSFAVSKIGKMKVISLLGKLDKLEKDGKVKYNYKTHPSIKERIEKIRL